jgi:hypothetical protein
MSTFGLVFVLLVWLIPSLFLFYSLMLKGLSNFVVGSFHKRILLSVFLAFFWFIILPLIILGFVVDFFLLLISKKD